MQTQHDVTARDRPMPQHQTITHSDLPVLSKYDVRSALSSLNKNFILDFMSPDIVGRYQYFDDLGVTLQYVGGQVIRCISLSTHEDAIITLGMMECSIRAVGGWLELAPYTVVVPHVPLDPQEEHSSVVALDEGMEVA